MSGRQPSQPAEGDLGFTPANDHDVISANRERFLQRAGIAAEALTLGRQVHGAGVRVAEAADRGRGQPPRFDGFPATDALVTACSDIALGTVVADCVPLLLYDRRNHVIAVAHAGWRGTVARIAESTLRSMVTAFGTRPSDVRVGIGPSIGPCCYEVGHEVIEQWLAAGVSGGERAFSRRGASYHFDLWSANRLQLTDCGVPVRQIEFSAICTRCEHERFFSYRAARAGLSPGGRMMLVAQLGARR